MGRPNEMRNPLCFTKDVNISRVMLVTTLP